MEKRSYSYGMKITGVLLHSFFTIVLTVSVFLLASLVSKNILELTDIGTEELAHMEMICAMVHQLTRNLTPEEINASGFAPYFVSHTNGVYQAAANGVPWTATYYQSKGDVITDLHEDLAAEQKARVTYDNLLRLIDDPDITDPLKFLREREVVHYQRFGDALRITQDNLNSKNFYAFNPSFD